MKKIILCASIFALHLDGASGMLVPKDDGKLAERRVQQRTISTHGVLHSRSVVSRNRTNQIKSVYKILDSSYDEANDKAIVRIGQIINGELQKAENESFPVIRKFVRYQHDFRHGVSHPVERLTSIITGHPTLNGEIVIREDFVNSSTAYGHNERITGYKYNDRNLTAMPYAETYITVNGREILIKNTERQERNVAYLKLSSDSSVREVKTGSDNAYDYYDRITTIRTKYLRPDHSVFLKETSETEKIAKPKPPAPMPPAPPRVVNQPAPSEGGVSNEFERFGHFVSGGGDCNVM